MEKKLSKDPQYIISGLSLIIEFDLKFSANSKLFAVDWYSSPEKPTVSAQHKDFKEQLT